MISMLNIIKPPRLNRGDTIGVVATSFPFPTDTQSDYFLRYKKAVSELEEMGFKIREGKNLRKTKWWFAGTPQERADDINGVFADKEVKAIIVHDGGQSAIATLEHIDYELVKSNPKPFMGFSDITNILIAIFTKTGLVGFHMDLLTYGLGGVWTGFTTEVKEQARTMFTEVLTSTNPIGNRKQFTPWQDWRSGTAEGMLFGGNLSMLSSLVGTRYFPKLEDLRGCIFFWETDNTQSYRIERGLYQLKYAGLFEVISGMVIGKLPDIKRTAWEGFTEPTPQEIVMEVLQVFNFPILAEVDYGHKSINTPMPIGLQAKIDADSLKLEVLEAAVS